MKHLIKYENFDANLYSKGKYPNLPVKDYDDDRYFMSSPGGPTGTTVSNKHKYNVDDFKIIHRGSNTKAKQKKRKLDDIDKSKKYRIAKMIDYQLDNDIVNFMEPQEPSTKA